ncbi:MAG: hypothetical protein ACYDA2_08165 [Acidimicrobiales bacterium]
MTPDIRRDPEYDEPVNIDMEPEEALNVLLSAPETDGGAEPEVPE